MLNVHEMTLLIYDLPAAHVDDVADAFIFLAELALKPNGGNAQWGDEGYYFVEDGDFVSRAAQFLLFGR